MDLTSTIFFVIAGLLLVILIIVCNCYSYRLEKANKRINTLENQVTELRRDKEFIEERLRYVKKHYVVTKRLEK